MINVGFTLIGRMGWTGGENYLRNMLGVIQNHMEGNVQAQLFLSPEEAETKFESFDGVLNKAPIVDERIGGAGRGTSLQKSLLLGRDKGLETLFKTRHVDLVFENAVFYGWRFGIPILAWMPDFQHHYMPELFSRRGWWRREVGFRMQTTNNRTIMLSSHTAKNDCEKFYPKTIETTTTVPFAVDFNPADHIGRKFELMQKYELPERFIYIPNQFWKHKNHTTVIQALALIASTCGLDKCLPVITSGPQKDPRHPELFDSLMADVKKSGLENSFRYLGLIPYMDVLGLIGAADYLANPSLFEGWSTPIEEAKALGAPMLLSDISIHREQVPSATFFDPGSPRSLADILLQVSKNTPPKRQAVTELQKHQQDRVKEYANSLMKAFEMGVK